jgi:hypothetical protein
MKITKSLGLSFFLFAFIATSFPEAVHAEDAAAVLDIFDDAVLAGARYLIITPRLKIQQLLRSRRLTNMLNFPH